MRLNIQLFASLNVGQTYESPTVNIVPYGYSSSAYAMKFTVSLDAQNVSGNYSTVTITSYMKTLGNSWGWSGFNKIYMERYTKANSESNYTSRNSTQLRSLPTNNANNWVNCGSWTGNIQHRSDGTCSLYVKNHLLTATSSSYSYIPRDTEQTSEELILNPLHKSPLISITGITELNNSLSGVPNDTFVQHLSKKRFTLSTTLYDSATIRGITVSNGETSVTGTASPLTLDFANKTLYTTANILPIKAVISDSMNSTGETTVNYSNYILYIKPTITPTLTTTKRNGQLSGKVLLNLIATFFNGTIGNTANTLTVKYRFWKRGTTEPSTWITIPSSSVSVSGNNVSVSNYEIGSTDTSASNYFNFENAYDIRIQINDAFYSDSTLKGVTVGESVWDEYKDRLRIKKAQIDTDIINPNLDLFNDTSGSDWKTMIKNKLDYCISNIKTSKENIETFINGGWSGVEYGFGIFSKIGTTYQLMWHTKNGYCYVRKVGNIYDYYSSIPNVLYNDSTGIQSGSYASVSGLSNYKKLAITFTLYKHSDYDNTGGTSNVCWINLSKANSNNKARGGMIVPYSSYSLSNNLIESDIFKALFEADITNNRVYCLFAYNNTVQSNNDYVMTKIEGYYN